MGDARLPGYASEPIKDEQGTRGRQMFSYLLGFRLPGANVLP